MGRSSLQKLIEIILNVFRDVPKLSNSTSVSESGIYALDAIEKNPSISGTMANKINSMDGELSRTMKVYTTLAQLGLSLSSDATLFPIQEVFTAMSNRSEFHYSIAGGHKFTNLGDPLMGGWLHIIRISNTRGYATFYQFNQLTFTRFEKYLHDSYSYDFVKVCSGSISN